MSHSAWAAVVGVGVLGVDEEPEERRPRVNHHSHRLRRRSDLDLGKELMAVGVEDCNLVGFVEEFGLGVRDEDAVHVPAIAAGRVGVPVRDPEHVVLGVDLAEADGRRHRRGATGQVEHHRVCLEEHRAEDDGGHVGRLHGPRDRHHARARARAPRSVEVRVVLDIKLRLVELQSPRDAVDGDEHLLPLGRVLLVDVVRRLEQHAVFLVVREHDAGRPAVEDGRDVRLGCAGRKGQQLRRSVEGVSDLDGADGDVVALRRQRRNHHHVPLDAARHVSSQLQLCPGLCCHESKLFR
mmetsp:Transcript_39142/g.92296  ORF Transcript_39142/g.92296 Transcript_39142/m.92296 type:complete len:295 (-) Transcript_39142:622-1506(-)